MNPVKSKAYKVVRVLNGVCVSATPNLAEISEGAFLVKYPTNELVRANVGDLFVFEHRVDAESFRNRKIRDNTGEHFEIWEVDAYGMRRAPTSRMLRVWHMNVPKTRMQLFWQQFKQGIFVDAGEDYFGRIQDDACLCKSLRMVKKL